MNVIKHFVNGQLFDGNSKRKGKDDEKNMIEPDSPDNSVFKSIAPKAYAALTKAGGPDLESLVFELFSPEAGITKGTTPKTGVEKIQIPGLVNRRKEEAMNDTTFAEIYNRLVTQ